MNVGPSKSISLRVMPVDKRTTHFVSVTEPFAAENTSQVKRYLHKNVASNVTVMK